MFLSTLLIGSGSLFVAGTAGALSWITGCFGRSAGRSARVLGVLPQVTILIPAHNEETKITRTLVALSRELRDYGGRVSVRVALDSCTDRTGEEAGLFREIFPLEIDSVSFQSKWRTLAHLVERSWERSDWLILLDAGTVWEPGVFRRIVETAVSSPDAIVIAPRYEVYGSFLQSIFWRYEAALKRFENRLGGPTSVHGATVAFRSKNLHEIFSSFGEKPFLNDDVILPLAARILYPEMRVIYLSDVCVSESATKAERPGLRAKWIRRRRMVLGNLQWMRWLGLRKAPVSVYLVAARRVLRPFWAWGFLFLSAGLLWRGCGWGVLAAIPFLLFPDAALASFLAPWDWITRRDQRESAWR